MIKHLLIKRHKGKALDEVEQLNVGVNGIEGGVLALSGRQVLILPVSTIREFNLHVGDLMENIITEGIDIHSIESGTVIKCGGVKIRLTYHCEPCKRIKGKVNLKEVEHRRGYLGTFMDVGCIRIGDAVQVLGKQFETIPYAIKERIGWYLDKQVKAVTVKTLANEIGLSPSYYRAIPNILKNMDEKYIELVRYPSKGDKNQSTLWND